MKGSVAYVVVVVVVVQVQGCRMTVDHNTQYGVRSAQGCLDGGGMSFVEVTHVQLHGIQGAISTGSTFPSESAPWTRHPAISVPPLPPLPPAAKDVAQLAERSYTCTLHCIPGLGHNYQSLSRNGEQN
ncbi:hypothetical protein F5883DRAFT_531526 [Diaporthe sp. PMI_573]|nr:hypothetical protein F5883DRAFT_531526 [Diaporthaceae sp. PMI_573]